MCDQRSRFLKPPKQRKKRDDLDDQVDFDNEFQMTNGISRDRMTVAKSGVGSFI